MRIILGSVDLAEATFDYDGVPAVRAVTFTARAGERLAILGPNGSGKSSVLSLIAGITSPSTGDATTRGEVAFVVQRSVVDDRMPLTVRDAVAMGRWPARGMWRPLRREDRTIIGDAMDRMGIADLAGRRLSALSGGQRQRALIAQALAQRADVVLLDEPEAGLDRASRAAISAVLREEAARGACVIIATHDIQTAREADRCILLRDGHLVADGTPEDTLTGAGYADAFLTASPPV